MEELSIIGSEDSHDTIMQEFIGHKPCKILEVPSGRGGLALFLKENGWDVHCADIDPGHLKADGIPFTQVNLNKRLPFEDASFDAVSCVNGIHRVLFPERTIQEFFRVLRPGGTLFLNVNNYSSIVKRLRFLISGSLEEMITVPTCEQTIDDPEAHVRNPIMYPRLHNILSTSGFKIESVKSAAVRRRHRALAPIAYLVKASLFFLPRSIRSRLRADEGNRAGVFPGGLYFLVTAVKQ